jgi:hypothetical protein
MYTSDVATALYVSVMHGRRLLDHRARCADGGRARSGRRSAGTNGARSRARCGTFAPIEQFSPCPRGPAGPPQERPMATPPRLIPLLQQFDFARKRLTDRLAGPVMDSGNGNGNGHRSPAHDRRGVPLGAGAGLLVGAPPRGRTRKGSDPPRRRGRHRRSPTSIPVPPPGGRLCSAPTTRHWTRGDTTRTRMAVTRRTCSSKRSGGSIRNCCATGPRSLCFATSSAHGSTDGTSDCAQVLVGPVDLAAQFARRMLRP